MIATHARASAVSGVTSDEQPSRATAPGGGSNADDMGEDAPGLNGVLLAADLPEAMAARDPLMIALTAGAAAACTERCGAVPRIAGLFLRWREISPTLTAPETT